jgi:hypothetical protein
MKPRRWLVLGCWAAGLFLGGYLCVTLIEALRYPFDHPSIVESQGRLTLAEAKNQLDVVFPDSAHDIQFACYRQWIAIEDFIRFEAPIDDCISFAEQTIARHNSAHPDRPIPGLSPITDVGNSGEISRSTELSTEWFDLAAIRNGFASGGVGSHMPQLWIDSDRGVVYFKYTD